MRSNRYKVGLTLVEMLVVLAIIAILVSMTIAVAGRIRNQSKEQLTKSTLALLNTALTQFQDYGYKYKDSSGYGSDTERDFYLGLIFPLDCNSFSQDQLITELKKTLDLAADPIFNFTCDPNYSGSEVLYFFLSQVPECQETLGKIDKSLVTNKNSNNQGITITVDNQSYPLLRIIDPWGTPLRYDYYNELGNLTERVESKRTFPVITSAGPDKKFDTIDDINSR
jgi:prepilin-type N-terminal cleavage/methylation domain-containing protein